MIDSSVQFNYRLLCTAQWSTPLYSSIIDSSVQFNDWLLCTVQWSTPLYSSMIDSSVQFNDRLLFTVKWSTPLYSSIIDFSVLFNDRLLCKVQLSEQFNDNYCTVHCHKILDKIRAIARNAAGKKLYTKQRSFLRGYFPMYISKPFYKLML